MALEINTRRNTVSLKFVGAFFAIMALFVQPLVALNIPNAFAATAVTVNPSNTNWYLYNDQNDAIQSDTSDHGFVNGPMSPPAGTGSVHLTKTGADSYGIATNQFAGSSLNSISSLKYSTYRASGETSQAASLGFDVDSDNTDSDIGYQGRLTYEPYFTHTVSTGAWQNWDTQDDAGTGNWWFSRTTLSGGESNQCVQSDPCTWSELNTKYPHASILGRFILRTNGANGQVFNGNVDNLTFNSTTYDFEPTPVPVTPVPTVPPTTGSVIFNTLPSPFVSNLPSQGYQATSTAALGDKIKFAGNERNLNQVQVVLSSWACETGTWNTSCVTTPGATFDYPVTLNLYNVATDGSVGSLIGTKTQTFSIPYRPSANASCADIKQWKDENGDCFNGINHVVTFDASGITVPDTIIYSVAFNTQSYGASPKNTTGPYDSPTSH